MTLITTSDIQNAANLHGYVGEFIAKRVMTQLKMDKINDLYDDLKETSGTQFLNQIFENLNIQIEIPEGELSRIPKTGAFIVVSNHPYGGLDGLILLKIIQTISSLHKLNIPEVYFVYFYKLTPFIKIFF